MSTITFYIIDNLKVNLACYISKDKILKHNAVEIVEKQVNDIKNLEKKIPKLPHPFSWNSNIPLQNPIVPKI